MYLHHNVNRSFQVACQFNKTVLSLWRNLFKWTTRAWRDYHWKTRLLLKSSLQAVGAEQPIWVAKRLKYCAVLRTLDVAHHRCIISDETVLIVTRCSSPSEDIVPIFIQLAGLAGEIPNDKILVVGNFNAKSSIWGVRPMDRRDEEVISFPLHHVIEIINSSDSAATVDSHHGQSCVDCCLSVNAHIGILTGLFMPSCRLVIRMPWPGHIRADQVTLMLEMSAVGGELGTWSGITSFGIC